MARPEQPSTAALLSRQFMSPGMRRLLEVCTVTTLPATTSAINLVVSDDPDVAVVDVAFDAGNARTVVLVRQADGSIRQILMPSVRSLHGAFSYEVFAQRGLSPASWSALAADEHIIEVGGVERFLGRLAIEHAPAAGSGRGSDARYADGTTLDFLLAGLAAALPKATQITARVATILPIALWSQQAPAVEQALRRTHKFSYGGRPVSLKVDQVLIRREGEAAFAALMPRPSGRTLIIDGGGRTINLALFADGQYKAGATLDNMGVEVALDNVDKELIGTGFRTMTLAERIELQDAMLAGQSYSIVAGNQRVRIDGVARKHFDASAAASVQEMHAKVKIEAAEQIHAIGGAAYPVFFGAVWKQKLLTYQAADLPELQNVYGALASLGGPIKKAKRR